MAEKKILAVKINNSGEAMLQALQERAAKADRLAKEHKGLPNRNNKEGRLIWVRLDSVFGILAGLRAIPTESERELMRRDMDPVTEDLGFVLAVLDSILSEVESKLNELGMEQVQ